MRYLGLIFLAIVGVALAVPTPPPTFTVPLTWVPPTQNTDGTPLTNLASYKVYFGVATRAYTQTVTVAAPATGTVVTPATMQCDTLYFFAVTVINSATPPTESAYSNEVTKRSPVCPKIPGASQLVTVDIVLNAIP